MRIIPKNFGHWSEGELVATQPKEFRLQEAFYFYDMFRVQCGQQPIRIPQFPNESQFHWITFADAFLSMVVSVEEFVQRPKRQRLRNSDFYLFTKQLRNITVHRTVLGGRRIQREADPLVHRIFSRSVGGSDGNIVEPKIDIERIRRHIGNIQRSGRHTQYVAASRRLLRHWKRAGNTYILLQDVFEKALEVVGEECGIAMVEP